jgi:LmbE family N-acetylglucosaminyl deacetylase
MFYLLRIVLFFICLTSLVSAQHQTALSSAKIYQQLKKLNVIGNVLYFAAHPDDENTGVLAFIANETLLNAAYLSLTRGDGGQNLIGKEIGDLLGVIRTQELLAARRIDGAKQYFSRAVDFGYSKSREEALQIWGESNILSDAVWVIRQFRPDVIITRFTPTLGGHGQHLASALLAEKAFTAAADPNAFPEQLQYVDTWQPKRLVWDVWTRGIDQMNLDTLQFVGFDIGTYNPVLGQSYTEIAARSRSMHKSQGFGSTPTRGRSPVFFRHTLGDSATNSLFDGIDLTWRRIPGGESVSAYFEEAITKYQPEQPTAIVPVLLQARHALLKLPESPVVKQKLDDLVGLLLAVNGLWISATAENYSATPGSTIKVKLAIVNRNGYPIQLQSVKAPYSHQLSSIAVMIPKNRIYTTTIDVHLPDSLQYSHPYWLHKEKSTSLHTIDKQTYIGLPELPAVQPITISLEIDGQTITTPAPIRYQWNDPKDGERFRNLEIVPEVAVNFSEPLQVFADTAKREITLTLLAPAYRGKATIRFTAPEGWQVHPESITAEFSSAQSEVQYALHIQPPAVPSAGILKTSVEVNGKTYPAHALHHIDYEHIPIQTLTPPANVTLRKLDIVVNPQKVGYIAGAGDELPAALEQLGYQVVMLDDEMLRSADLNEFDVIITGIRAYNTREVLAAVQPRLNSFVANGGTLLVQYNTSHRLVTEALAPYPLKLSRDRVTDENAEVHFLAPDHPIFNKPNKITLGDFEGWVQERGLYFPDEWDRHYTPLLAWNDPGESPKKGALLYATFGKGHFIYTGISFFRQIPAGVPGAYRLLVNLISVGQ